MTIGSWKLFTKTRIGGKQNPLMMRYVLFRCNAFGIYVHQFLRSDHDRALHDHPWNFIAIILKGGYMEIHDQTIDGSEAHEVRRPWQVLVRPAEWRHRVSLFHRNVMRDGTHSDVITSWSLCIAGRRCRKWGFFMKWYETANVGVDGTPVHQNTHGPGPYSTVAVERTKWCHWKRYDDTRGICVDHDIYDGED